MPSEITHKSAFRFGPILWGLVIAFIAGFIAHGWMWAEAAPKPCPPVVGAALAPDGGR